MFACRPSAHCMALKALQLYTPSISHRMKNLITLLLLIPCFVLGFAPDLKGPLLLAQQRSTVRSAPHLSTNGADDFRDTTSVPVSDGVTNSMTIDKAILLPATILLTALPAEAAGVLPSALWAYGHYFSILVITGCLVAERNIVKADMSVEDEDTIVKIDLVYGLMAALLIISGFARAAKVSNCMRARDLFHCCVIPCILT